MKEKYGVYKNLNIEDGTPHGKLVRDSDNTKRLQQFAEYSGYSDMGEVLIMINKQYGYIWETIPSHKFDEIRIYLKNWIKSRYKIIDLELYNKVRNHCFKNKLPLPYGFFD